MYSNKQSHTISPVQPVTNPQQTVTHNQSSSAKHKPTTDSHTQSVQFSLTQTNNSHTQSVQFSQSQTNNKQSHTISPVLPVTNPQQTVTHNQSSSANHKPTTDRHTISPVQPVTNPQQTVQFRQSHTHNDHKNFLFCNLVPLPNIMHNQTKKGKLYGISSVVRKISLHMIFSFNVGTSNRKYRLSVSHSYSYIGLLVAGFGCVKRQQQAIKMYIKKDNK
jgi:hypothetical protein